MRRFEPFEPRPRIAVAVSGGADSMALALLADRWVKPLGGEVVAVTVDHGMRPESAAEALRVAGWMEARGVVRETTPDGDKILMGEGASMEILAEDARGPRNAGQTARLLYRRVVEFYPNSPLAPEAAWRAADIRWQFEKADAFRRPSAKEREAYLREQLYEDEMKKIIKTWPGSKQADLAAFEMIDNKLCGDWQGQPKCPEKESEYYEKFAAEHPDGPRTAQALYQATYRQAVLGDMYAADGSDKKMDVARNHARELAKRMADKFPTSDYTARAAALVYKVDQGLAVYGSDKD